MNVDELSTLCTTYPHSGDNHGDKPYRYPQYGDKHVDNLGIRDPYHNFLLCHLPHNPVYATQSPFAW